MFSVHGHEPDLLSTFCSPGTSRYLTAPGAQAYPFINTDIPEDILRRTICSKSRQEVLEVRPDNSQPLRRVVFGGRGVGFLVRNEDTSPPSIER